MPTTYLLSKKNTQTRKHVDYLPLVRDLQPFSPVLVTSWVCYTSNHIENAI